MKMSDGFSSLIIQLSIFHISIACSRKLCVIPTTQKSNSIAIGREQALFQCANGQGIWCCIIRNTFKLAMNVQRVAIADSTENQQQH